MSPFRVLVCGASGGFGRWFTKLLEERAAGGDDLEISGCSRRPVEGPWARFHATDPARPDPELEEELGRSQLVLACLPPEPAVALFRRSLELLPKGACFADILSVKAPMLQAWAEAEGGLEALSLHPMFAPDLDAAGRPVAVVRRHPGAAGDRLLAWLEGRGARLVELAGEEHDRATAILQVAVHAALLAFGRVAAKSGLEPGLLRSLGTPPSEALFAALERMRRQDPGLYWEIQEAHPGGPGTRRALAEAAALLADLVEQGDAGAFREWLESLDPGPSREI